ncbi:glutamine amidotransferase [Herminiimonas aquatilis]|uniref:Glutamine amidotransferase n=1 Tax=Herminiimonas aquatilis TaxID=345342 RepID=A0ABW2J9A0_9BURK
MGVYDGASYPFITHELQILKSRMAADMPTMGICLGAQLMAHALGSRVYPGPAKEIGWSSLKLSDAGNNTPLRHLEGHAVLHWHGDTFDLPEHCDLLASTEIYRNQAFARGTKILGLQFHPEVVATKFESWLIGHACELAAAKISPQILRAETLMHGKGLAQAADLLFAEWLSKIR